MPSSNKNETHKEEKSATGGIASRINEFMDQQRLERLKQCQEIDAVLKQCLQRRQQMLNKEPVNVQELDVDQTVPGTRMMRYFGWHQETGDAHPESASFSSILQSTSSDNNERGAAVVETEKQSTQTTSTSNTSEIPTCAKETHALWACRSVCLGCAEHLRNLKDCFQLIPEQVLNVPNNAYEPTTYTGTIPCRQSQEELGKCVVTKAKELQKRLHPDDDSDKSE